jgi:hypothetical protein
MAPTVSLSAPSDLIAIVPYQLGFHPDRSGVLVFFAGRRLTCLQRWDNPTAGEQALPAPAAALARRTIRHEAPTSVIVIGYEERAGDTQGLRSALTAICRRLGVAVQEELVVLGRRWRSTRPELGGGVARPGPWRPLPAAPDVPAVAEWVGLGVSPLPDRASLESLFTADAAQPPLVSAQAVRRRREALRRDPQWRRVSALAWRRVLDPDGAGPPVPGLPPRVLADAVAGLDDTDLRDVLVSWLAPGLWDVSAELPAVWDCVFPVLGPTPWSRGEEGRGHVGAAEAERCLRRLRGLASACQPRLQPPVLTLLAALAWDRGQGALAAVASERAVRLDPHHTLAALLWHMVGQGIRWDARAVSGRGRHGPGPGAGSYTSGAS